MATIAHNSHVDRSLGITYLSLNRIVVQLRVGVVQVISSVWCILVIGFLLTSWFGHVGFVALVRCACERGLLSLW